MATGLVTVTSITFSLLLLAVQQTASSLSPVVFDQFVRRRSNQIYLVGSHDNQPANRRIGVRWFRQRLANAIAPSTRYRATTFDYRPLESGSSTSAGSTIDHSTF